MKKLYILLLSLLPAAVSYAQADEIFVLINEAGETVPNGSTVTVKEYEESPEGIVFDSGLSVKNVSSLGGAESQSSLKINIADMPSGHISVCYVNCENFYAAGEHQYTQKTPVLSTKDPKPLRSEWITDEGAYGTCTVTYTVQRYSYDSATKAYTFIADGPSVTVKYVYADPASVAGVEAGGLAGQAYNLQGQHVDSSYKGIVIRNGRKLLVR